MTKLIKSLTLFNLFLLIFALLIFVTEVLYLEDKAKNKQSIIKVYYRVNPPLKFENICKTLINKINVYNNYYRDFGIQSEYLDIVREKYKYKDKKFYLIDHQKWLYDDIELLKKNILFNIQNKNEINAFLSKNDSTSQELSEKLTSFIQGYHLFVLNKVNNYFLQEIKRSNIQINNLKLLKDHFLSKTDKNLTTNLNLKDENKYSIKILNEERNSTIRSMTNKLKYLETIKDIPCTTGLVKMYNTDIREISKKISIKSTVIKYLTFIALFNIIYIILYGRKLFK